MDKKCDKMKTKNLDNRIRTIDELPLWLNVNDVSQALDIGRNSTYELFNSVGFPKFRVAGQNRVFKDDFIDWCKNNII